MSEIIGGPSVPVNTNYLHNNKYKLIFRKLPTVTYFCNEAAIPGVSINSQSLPNIVNRLNVGGTKVTFEDFNITFAVDEDLVNYIELREWIIGIGAPTTTDEFKNLIANNSLTDSKGYHIYSDARLATLTNTHQMNVGVVFHDMFPISIGPLQFKDGVNAPLSATATFKYLNFEFSNDPW